MSAGYSSNSTDNNLSVVIEPYNDQLDGYAPIPEVYPTPDTILTHFHDVTKSTSRLCDDVNQLNCSIGMDTSSLKLKTFPSEANVPLAILLSCFALFTVLGNLIVILAVARERYLRSATTYFMVSLAIADLVIGAVVMPFAISLEVTKQHWFFGKDWCDVWHSFDVLASTASILNLSVIALDRYWAITNPITYPTRMTHSRILVLIAMVWILSSVISFPAILWWRAVAVEHTPEHVCMFTDDIVYLVFSSIISFYVPISIILFAYYRIYRAASAQIRSIKMGAKVMSNSGGKRGQTMTLRIHRGGRLQRIAHEAVRYARASTHDRGENQDGGQSTSGSARNQNGGRGSTGSAEGVTPSKLVSRKWQKFAISRKLSKIAKEQKAAKTLGIVLGVFCICWVPYFVMNVLFGICNTQCVKYADILFPIFTWLGYLNSGMNPVIYACSMRDFRRAFYKILCCCFPAAYKFKHMTRTKQYTPEITVTTSHSPPLSARDLESTAFHLRRSNNHLHVNGKHRDLGDSSDSLYDALSVIDS